MKPLHVFRTMALLCLTIASLQANAVEPYQEYRKHVEGAQTLTALNDELMGDSVSLYNGATEFSVTDIDLPGNNALPVRLTRRLAIEMNPYSLGSSGGVGDVTLNGAGNWDVDIPYISGAYISSAGWSSTRCTYISIPVATGLNSTDFWHGNTVHMPGGSDRLMLQLESQAPRPSGGAPSLWTTRERDMFACIPMKSGLAGEGFQMQTASLRYDFDVAVSRYMGYMGRNVPGTSVTYTVSRIKYFLLASKISDRFGNTVSFTYNTDGHPTSIISSDDGGTQRKITLTYSGGRLATATANGRTWQYQYGSGDNAGMLASVTQPDASQWQYVYTGDLSPNAPTWDGNIGPACKMKPPITPGAYSIVVTHPSGAKGTFEFSNTRHYRSGVSAGECVHEQVQQGGTWFDAPNLHTPNYFDVMSLQSKAITGPGVAQPMTWTYDYGISNQQLVGSGGGPAVYPCTTCPTEKIVTVTRPDGTQQKYHYGFLYAVNEGRLQGSSVLKADGTVKRTETTTYMTEEAAVSQTFFPRYGIIIGSDGPSTATVRPITSQTVEQDGTTYTMQVGSGGSCGASGVYCFDLYGNPTLATKSNSQGYTRTEQTAYFNQTAKWILGQTASVACTAPASCAGLVMSQTTYDATTALPLKSYAFGKLKQTLTYNADGTVATMKDGGNHTTTLASWKRGTPQTITYPATTDQPTAVHQSAVVDDNGWIGSITDENGYKTSYTYDAMGRVTGITYPTGDTPAATPTTLTYQQMTAAEYGIPANHWKQTVSTGNARKVVYFDAFWRPLVEEAYDNANAANTRSLTVNRYDNRGRPIFQGYPLRTLSNYAATTLTGVDTAYDALDRVTSTSQDSEVGALTTTSSYLNNANGPYTLVTDASGNQTRTWYQAFDQPGTDAPVTIWHPEGAYTDITRDVFGKPTAIRRHDAGNTIAATRSYVYNANQELCKAIEPETGSTVMHYDATGNLDWSASGQALPSTTACNTDSVPVAQIVTRSYDARNRVKTLVFPDNLGNTTYTYAPDGLVTSLLVDNGGAPWSSRTMATTIVAC